MLIHVVHVFLSQVMNKIHKACRGYNSWKSKHNPHHKPWLYPEQITLPRLNIVDILPMNDYAAAECIDESDILESEVKDDDDDL